MTATTTGTIRQLRHTYRGEQAWFELLEEVKHRRLRLAFIAAEVSPTLAGQLVWFLDEQATLDRHLAEASRVRYRRALAELDFDHVAGLARAIPG